MSLDIQYTLHNLGQWLITSLLLFKVARCIWWNYLAYREHLAIMKNTAVPEELTYHMPASLLKLVKEYRLKCLKSHCIYDIYRTILELIWLYFKLINTTWEFSGLLSQNELSQTVIFVTITTLMRALTVLPYQYYKTFYIEVECGVTSKEYTKGEFFWNKLDTAMTTDFKQVVIAICYFLVIRWTGELFYIFIMLGAILTEIISHTTLSEYLTHTEGPSSPLPPGPLKNRIEEVATAVNFPIARIVMIEGNNKLTKSESPYYLGMFKGNRIVVCKSMMVGYIENAYWKPSKRFTVEELAGIVAHELGHWKLNHNFQQIVYHQAILFFELLLTSRFMAGSAIYEMFDFYNEHPTIIGLIITNHVLFEPFSSLVGYLARIISRCQETEADEFAQRLGLGKPLSSALCKVASRLLILPMPDSMFVDFFYSHPPMLSRVRSLMQKRRGCF